MNLHRWFVVCIIALSIGDIYSKTVVEKKAAIVIDYTNGKKVLYADKADATRYPASLTKMMTLYILFDALKKKKVTLNTKFRVSKYATWQAPSKLDLKIGARISVSDAIKALLVKSANDIAVVVAEGIAGNVGNFCKLMNKRATQLGMKNTHFENPSGLPNLKQTCSARDMAKLGMALYHDFPQYRHFFSLKQFSYGKKKYNTRCKILHWYKGADAAKTGYICASGYNLMVTASRADKSGKSRRLFVVVMGGDTAKARDIYAGQLMDKYFGECLAPSVTPSTQKSQTPKQSLNAQIGKSEMLDGVMHDENEVLVENEQVISKFNKMLDDLYRDNDECLSAEDEIVINPKKSKGKKRKH